MSHFLHPLIAALALAIGAIPPNPASEGAPSEATEPSQHDAIKGLLFVDPERHPIIEVRWTDKSGILHRLSGTRPYAYDAERTPLGGNIACYAAVGGTRLTKGAGHPAGAVVRTGFYKIDNAKPFFDGATRDTEITVAFKGIRFNQPVDPRPETLVQHLKYDPGDMQACGLPGDAREQFNLVSTTDTLNDRVRPAIDTRQGALDGSADALGDATVAIEEDGSVSMTLTFRYPALRNLRDPWKSDLPGTFLEPFHFHAEFEVLPEGVEPLAPPTPAD